MRTPSSAKWLITGLIHLRIAIDDALASGETAQIISLQSRYNALESLWRSHPLWFEIDHDCVLPRRLQYQISMRGRVTNCLQKQGSVWSSASRLLSLCSCANPVTRRRMSERALQKALKQLLLEGRVQRRFGVDGLTVEWRRAAAPTEDC